MYRKSIGDFTFLKSMYNSLLARGDIEEGLMGLVIIGGVSGLMMRQLSERARGAGERFLT